MKQVSTRDRQRKREEKKEGEEWKERERKRERRFEAFITCHIKVEDVRKAGEIYYMLDLWASSRRKQWEAVKKKKGARRQVSRRSAERKMKFHLWMIRVHPWNLLMDRQFSKIKEESELSCGADLSTGWKVKRRRRGGGGGEGKRKRGRCVKSFHFIHKKRK